MKAKTALLFSLFCTLELAHGASPTPLNDTTAATGMVLMERPDTGLTSVPNVKARRAMLNRIEQMVGIDAPKEDRRYQSIVNSHGLGLLLKIPFQPGQGALSTEEREQLKAVLAQPAHSFSDNPAMGYLVLGYADSAENSVANVYLSKDRADFVAGVMQKEMGIANWLSALPMGGSPLFDPSAPKRAYAVEIWIMER